MAVSPNTHSRRVYDLMQNPVWQVAAAASPSSGGGSGGSTTPATLGSPEKVPQHTFVAQARPNDNGFIRTAFLYHQTYGLNPQTVVSFEDIVTRLASSTTALDRIRIVSHFFFDPTGTNPANMNMAFFTGQSSFTQAWQFKYGISDAEGIKALLLHSLASSYSSLSNLLTVPINAGGGTARLEQAVILALKIKFTATSTPTISALLGPFGLVSSNSSSNADIMQLVRYYSDLFAIIHINPINLTDRNGANHALSTAQRTALIGFINDKITALKNTLRTGSRTDAQMDALQNAIGGLVHSDFPATLGAFPAMSLYTNLEPEYFQNHSTFRTHLNTVKNRFSNTSFVDLRGCRVAADNPTFEYLNAVRSFFGNSGSEPHVSGPEWFQSFPFLGFIPLSTEANVDSFFNSGGGGMVRDDVRRAFSNWSGRIGIPAHLSFYKGLVTGDVLDFLSMNWKTNLPRLNMEAVRYNGFAPLDFAGTIQRLGQIFDITGAALPNNASMLNFDATVQPTVSMVRQLELQPDTNNLSTMHATITTVASTLSVTLTSFPADNPSLTLPQLQPFIQQLKQHITAQANIGGFLTAINTKLDAATAGIRYLFFTGLPLIVQRGNNEDNIRMAYLQALRDDAAISFMRGQWGDPLPTPNAISNGMNINWGNNPTIPNGPGPNDDDLTDRGRATQVAALSNDRNDTIFVINPMYEYNDHIKSIP